MGFCSHQTIARYGWNTWTTIYSYVPKSSSLNCTFQKKFKASFQLSAQCTRTPEIRNTLSVTGKIIHIWIPRLVEEMMDELWENGNSVRVWKYAFRNPIVSWHVALNTKVNPPLNFIHFWPGVPYPSASMGKMRGKW